ncbi:uncharacterized protein LOC144672709 isoform X5 [Cetorhinus maximus]
MRKTLQCRSNGAPPEQFSELCNKKLAQNEEYWQQVGLDSCWGTTPWPLPAIRCLDQMRMYEIHTNQMVLNFCLHEFNTVVNPSLISIILGFHCLNTRSWGRMKSMPVPEPSL